MSEVQRKDEIQGEIIHEYDGIEEADNDLPRWWLGIFIASIGFAIGYWFYYHEFESGPLPREAYAAAMAAQAGDEVTPELLRTIAEDETTVSAGQQIFQTNCVACHAAQGEGNIGPNLTDEYWIHGGGAMDIYAVIDEGVLTAGMPPWGGPLGPKGMKEVTAYVISIRDTNVPGKEPQGEVWTPGQEGDEPAEGEDELPGIDAEDIDPETPPTTAGGPREEQVDEASAEVTLESGSQTTEEAIEREGGLDEAHRAAETAEARTEEYPQVAQGEGTDDSTPN